MDEQWIIDDGDNIFQPVGPFASEEEAEAHYALNQPQGTKYLRRPVIVRLLKPSDPMTPLYPKDPE